ncbi:3'-5' exonuclease [Novymonas esmeraldas]|uniref:3'-5' exonuclease n=1 Tax=Novymonas esmeraldas TaxID=1808958 RepID=A0AAW0F8Y5_9TRYP
MAAVEGPPSGQPRGVALPGPRRRLVIDPIWKVIDVLEYRTLWRDLTAEAASYGFVGLDMEWTTVMLEPEADSDGNTSPKTDRGASRRPKAHRLLKPVATVQISTCTCTLVVKWLHLHALTDGGFTDVLRDPFAPASAGWPRYREGQRQNPATVLREVYADVLRLIHDRSIFKTGVGIHGDEVKLHRDYPVVQLRAAVDLVELADACLPATVPDLRQVQAGHAAATVQTDSLRGLKTMCAALTGRELGKDMAVVMSDWSGCHGALTPLQIEYAAEDAEASYDVCIAILALGGFITDHPDSTPARWMPWTTVAGVDCREVLACCTTDSSVASRAAAAATTTAARPVPHPAADAAPSDLRPRVAGADVVEEVVEQRCCKGRDRPYYDNINVFAPSMELVFTVDRAKADWYVTKKGLANVVQWRTSTGATVTQEERAALGDAAGDVDVAGIQLSFTPDFARYNDAHIRRNMDYFKQPKENICVVCGGGGSLVRFAVVPLMYRRFFPSVYMSHNSYDLLLLCPRCFATSRLLYDRLRRRVADDFGIPIVLLRGKQRDEYAAAVRAMAQSVAAPAEDRDEAAAQASTASDVGGAFEQDCDLHPRLRLRGMQEYLALMEHREVLDTVFAFAKALHRHNETLRNGASGEAKRSVLVFPDSAGGPSVSAEGQRAGYRRSRSKSQATAPVAALTILPESRRAMMAHFLQTHASVYPFFTTDGAEESQRHGWRLQEAVFSDDADGGVASAQGVRFILTGSEKVQDGAGAAQVNTSRGVLTRYWVGEHPELLAVLPAVTRVEERLRQPAGGGCAEGPDVSAASADDGPGDEESGEVPYVDSHAFIVIRLLLEKYTDAAPGSKTGEHAVGQFIYRWRSGFVAGMQPQHLPRGWVPEDGILR